MALLLVYALLQLTNGCSNLIEEIQVYPLVMETKQWDLQTLFQGNNLNYAFLQQQNDFMIIPPIYQQHQPTEHLFGVDQIVAAKAMADPVNYAWRNLFAFIEQDSTSVDIFYNNEVSIVENYPPHFDKIITITTNDPTLRCFDIDFVDFDTFIIDCGMVDTQGIVPIKNVFYIVPKVGTVTTQNNDNLSNNKVVAKRQLMTVFKKSQQMLVRASYEDDGSSFIESFLYQQDKFTNTLYILNGEFIGEYLNVQEPSKFKFNLMDLTISHNGDIFILDKNQGVFEVQFTIDYQWSIVKQYKPIDELAIAFAASTLLKPDGTYFKYLIILYSGHIVIYRDYNILTTMILEFTVVGAAKVKIANDIIMVENKGSIHLYNLITYSQISKQILEGQEVLLANPYHPDIITISKVYAHRYLVSNGYLKLMPTNSISVSQTTLQLEATSDLGQKCTVDIKYQRVNADNKQIFRLVGGGLPTVVSAPSEPFSLGRLVSGPNLHYAMGESSLQKMHISSFWEITQSIPFPYPSTIVFSDLLSVDDQYYYQLVQTQDLNCRVWMCNEVDFDKAMCKETATFQLSVKLQQNTFSWWNHENQLTMSYLVDMYSLAIHMIQDGKLLKIHTIEFESSSDKNQISSFLFMNDNLYIVQAGLNVLICYAQFFPVEKKEIIDMESVKKLGYKYGWAPKRVFGNRDLRSTLLFIENGDSILIADFHRQLTFLKHFSVIQGSTRYISIGKLTFFLVQQSEHIGSISEYNIESLDNIYLMKELPMYQYSLSVPLKADYCIDTGYLFVRAIDSKSKPTLLVYIPNMSGHSALLKALDIGQQVPEGQQFILSVSGNKEMVVYINNGAQQNVLSLMQQPLLLINTDLQSNQYIQESQMILKITNYPESNQVDIIQQIKIINTQTSISMDLDELRSQNDLYLNDATTTHSLNDDWYQGQVVGFQLSCDQCVKDITLVNKVNKLNDKPLMKGQTLRQYTKYNNNLNVIQGNREILFMDKQDNMVRYVNLAVQLEYQCTQVVVNYDGSLLLSLCSDGYNQLIHATQCLFEECFPMGPKFIASKFKSITHIAKIGILGSSLLVLNCNPNNLLSYPGNLHIYQINYQETAWEFTNEIVVDNVYLKLTNTMYFSDFEIADYQDQYHIYVTDTQSGLVILQSKVDMNQQFKLIENKYVDVRTLLTNQGLVLKSDTQFISAKYVNYSRNLILNVNVLVMTNNAAHYSIRLIFDQQFKYRLDYLLNQYGSWSARSSSIISGVYAAILYQSAYKQFIAVYKLPVINMESTYHIQLIEGGIQFDKILDDNFAYMSGTLLYVLNSRLELTKYELNDNIRLTINQDTYREYVTFKAWNDFSTQESKLLINFDFQADKSNVWWIVLLCVTVAVIILVGGFFWYKRKQPKPTYDIQQLLSE